MAARGYTSHSELYTAGQRYAELIDAGVEPIVFYIGDHDPSGCDMTRSLEAELSLYARQPITIIRLGLTLDQVLELDLPPNPAKESDSRYQAYVTQTGCYQSWELDALQPQYIDALIEEAIISRLDPVLWDEAMLREEKSKRKLKEIADQLAA